MGSVLKIYKKYEVYIVDRETREPVMALAEPAKRGDLVGLKGKGWHFNGSDIFRSVEIVYKVTLGGHLQGLIAFSEDPDKQAVYAINVEVAPHNLGSKSQGYIVGPTLFALAAQHSIEWDWDGYVFFEAKTKLIPYYAAKLDAKLTMPPKGMSLDEVQAGLLVDRYIVKEVVKC